MILFKNSADSKLCFWKQKARRLGLSAHLKDNNKQGTTPHGRLLSRLSSQHIVES